MAEIDVVKKSSMTWLWVLLAIVVVALGLWLMMSADGTDRTTELRATPVPGISGADARNYV